MKEKDKVVGVDLQITPRSYTRNGYKEKAAVIQLCVGEECLLYHIYCVADGIPPELDVFFRKWEYKFVGFDIPKDQKMLYYCLNPLFIINHIDMHASWRNPDIGSTRKQSIMDVAAIFVDKSYKDSVVLTAEEHRQWGRSEERRVGKECTSWCRSRWSPYH